VIVYNTREIWELSGNRVYCAPSGYVCVYDNDFFVEIVSLKCIVCMYARVTVRKHENNIFVLSFMCVCVL